MTQGSFVCGRDLFNEKQLIYYNVSLINKGLFFL